MSDTQEPPRFAKIAGDKRAANGAWADWAQAQMEAKDAQIAKAERLLLELARGGVDKLTELAPGHGWDSGEKVAEMYIRRLRSHD